MFLLGGRGRRRRGTKIFKYSNSHLYISIEVPQMKPGIYIVTNKDGVQSTEDPPTNTKDVRKIPIQHQFETHPDNQSFFRTSYVWSN